MPPLAPMLAKATEVLPDGGGWLYEPKWDGFRCIVFRDGDEIVMASRNERPFNRYFPELIAPLRSQLPLRCVVDGELVVASREGANEGLDFDALQQRIHPAESRVNRLAAETPASFLAFDLIALGDRDLKQVPLSERRRLLEDAVATSPPIYLTPATIDFDTARDWFHRFEGAGLDGVVAKRLDAPYVPGERTMIKVKHKRTADCVVAGYRVHKDGVGVGSLLLGLYDDEGSLHHVGVCGSFTAKYRRELNEIIEPLKADALANHPWKEWADAMAHLQGGGRMPGAPSRWNATKDLSWSPLRPERVVEVTYSQVENGRFRHNAQFLRWRDDRDPRSCTYEQLDVAAPVELQSLFTPR